LGVVKISISGGEKSIELQNIGFDKLKDVTPDKEVEATTEQINYDLKPMFETVIGKTEILLDGKKSTVRKSESDFTRLVCNGILEETGADLVLMNGGTFRDSIKAGDITKQNIITVFPFGNYIVTKQVTGQTIIDSIQFGMDQYPETAGKFPQMAGIRFDYNVSDKKVENVLVGGKVLELDKKYKLATNDFIAAGGDGYDMLKDAKEINQFSSLEQTIIEYFGKVSPITSKNIPKTGITFK
jgi:5'-nucleotidase